MGVYVCVGDALDVQPKLAWSSVFCLSLQIAGFQVCTGLLRAAFQAGIGLLSVEGSGCAESLCDLTLSSDSEPVSANPPSDATAGIAH